MAIMHSIYREAGLVQIDEHRCTQCGACAQVCASATLRQIDGHVRVVTDQGGFGCIACGHCMMICPVEAVRVTGRGIHPRDVQPMPPETSRATTDSLAALMQARRSIRHFRDQEVDPAIIERVVELASKAPMAIPPWDVGCVRVLGREQVRYVENAVIKGYEGFLKLFRPWVLKVMFPLLGRKKYDIFTQFIRPLAEGYVQMHRDGCDVLFYRAPAMLIFHQSPYADSQDAVIAGTYAMLAAESLGLGSTIIGGAPAIMQRDRALCRHLGIPDGNKPVMVLILGYPSVHFRRTVNRRFTSELES